MKIKIISEDRYGGEFLKGVIKQLNEKGLVENISVKESRGLPVLCNVKLDRILRAFDNTCDRILIVLDSDNPQNYDDVYARTQSHVPKNMTTQAKIVLADYEIEEWICISKKLKWQSKPSEELKNKFKYTKSSLPKYASELDIDELTRKCNSFKVFLKALQP